MSEATYPAEDDWRRGVLRLAPRQPILRGPGDLLSRSLEAFSATFPLTLTLYLLLLAPFDVAMAALADSGHGAWISLLQLAPMAWVTVAVTYAIAIRDRDGRIPTLGEAMNWGRIHWLRALGYMIVVGLVVFPGLLLLIVPGLILAAWLALVMPIVAFEGRGRPAVLQRSRELTIGYRKTLFWAIVVF